MLITLSALPCGKKKKKDLSSSYTYPAPGPESVIISKEFILFSAEWHLKTKTWVIGVLAAIRYHSSQALPKNPARKYMYPLSSTGDVQSLVLMKQIRLNISRISWDPETWTSLSILLNPQPKELCLQRGGLVQSLRAPPPLPKPPTVLWGLLLPPVVSAFILLLTILLSLCASNFLAS